MIEFCLAMLVYWLVYAAIALALSAPFIFLARKRVDWHAWELLAFVLPFSLWAVLVYVNDAGKSLSNLVEPFVFVPAIPMAVLARAIVGRRYDQTRLAAFLIVLLCLVAAGVYLLMPALPE